jgi:LysR family transcriptional regulator, flagellar master operon regulator
MNLELLRTFLELNHTRHFGKAAEALHLTQAAVSARIKHLESLLGVKLFDRVRRDIRLTPEGTRLLRHADGLLAGWRKARQEVGTDRFEEQLSLGGSLRLWDVLLQEWLHALHRHYPALAIIAECHTPEILTRRLVDGLLDIAIMLEPAQLEVLRIEEVALIKLVMVSTQAGSSVEQALSDGYLMVDWGLGHALQHRRMYPDAPEPQIRMGQARMALSFVMQWGGAAYLPTRMVADALGMGMLHLVDGAERLDYHAYAVYPVRATKEALIQSTLELFEREFPLDD